MSFTRYLRFACWDFLLVALASIALSYTLMNSFYIDPVLQYGPWPAVMALGVLVLLYLAAFNRRSLRLGAPAVALVVVGGLVAAAALSEQPFLEDREASYFYFALVGLLVPVACFLLARKRGGTAVLLIVGIFACGWIQFFYGRYELAWTLVFLASSLALIVYKNYQLSARTATTVGRLSFSAGFGVALASVAVAVGLGSAVWFGIIAPMSPGAVQIKLITEVRALETLPVQGSSDEYLTPRMDLTSDKTNDDERTTDDLKQSEDGRPEPARPRDDTQVEEEQSGSLMGLDLDSVVQAFDFESNAPQAWLLVGLLLLVPLAIAAYFVGRRLMRTRRLSRISALPPADQVRSLYRFVIGRLERLGFAVPPGATVLEFARSSQGAMERMDATTQASFGQITDAYVDVAYGGMEPTESQVSLLKTYYRNFWKAARAQLGPGRYFVKSFRL